MGSASARASAQTAIAERKEQLKMMGKLRKQADKLKKVSLIQYFDKMVIYQYINPYLKNYSCKKLTITR